MKYTELIKIMHKYRCGTLSRYEMCLAIGLWQRSISGGKIVELKKNTGV